MLSRKARRRARAEKRERAGDLSAAVTLFLAAEAPAEAARVLLLQVSAEASVERRMAMLARAAQLAAGTEQGREAKRRQAMLSFDLLRQHRGALLRGELLQAANALEEAGCLEEAAEAFALIGDDEGEIRVLSAAGAIDRLEKKLERSSLEARQERDRKQLIVRIRDLDAIAERRSALEHADHWLRSHPDEGVQYEAQRIRDRLLRGPQVTLAIAGETRHYVLGSSITVGRAGADVVVASQAISRQHLRLSRGAEGITVEDLQTRNGTLLAGARLSGPLQVRGALSLSCAGQVPCTLTPRDGLLQLEIAGKRWLLPLGPLRIGDWEIVDAHDGDDRFVVLRTPDGAALPHTHAYQLAQRIELCRGDQLRASREGPILLAVPELGQRGSR